MPVRHSIWQIGTEPKALQVAKMDNERLLEDMIVAAPEILSDEWMIIGRQVYTNSGKKVDLLAVAPDASLVLIEIKRDRTSREVVAQALDYASWVEQLEGEDLETIYGRFQEGCSLKADFKKHFGIELDESELNQSHQIVVVASSLDPSTERIVGYLNDREVPINVLFFQVFQQGGQQLLSRSWLIDPDTNPAPITVKADKASEPWNGEFYCSFGQDIDRSWEDAVEFGFISAGGKPWYTRTLRSLKAGDRVWVKVPKQGFVGVGEVVGPAQPAAEFEVQTEDGLRPILEVAKRGNYLRDLADDYDKCEYFVPMEWFQTVTLHGAVNELGLFGNQNTICRPRDSKWRSTVERLKEKFPNHNRTGSKAEKPQSTSTT